MKPLPLFTLNERNEVVAATDAVAWGMWLTEARANGRDVVAKDRLLCGALVSTVFTGLAWVPDVAAGAPVRAFETLVFGSPAHGERRRAATFEEAMRLHREVVGAVIAGTLRADAATASIDAVDRMRHRAYTEGIVEDLAP